MNFPFELTEADEPVREAAFTSLELALGITKVTQFLQSAFDIIDLKRIFFLMINKNGLR